MATPTSRPRCTCCGKEKAVVKCGGCLQDFCYNHMTVHRQDLSKQLDEIGVTHNLFRQTLREQSSKPQKYALMQQIDQWEHDSMNKIRTTAEEARQLLLKHNTEHFNRMEIKLNELANQLRESRKENDFVEIDLQQWKQQLNILTDELSKPSTIRVTDDTTPLVTKICISISASSYTPSFNANAKWIQNGITVAGSKGVGDGTNQLNNPYGLYVDDDQTIYIADCSNYRIMEWRDGATSGRIVAGGNGLGDRLNQLSGPIDVILDKKSDSLIICDYNNRRVVRWPRQNGTTGEIIISGVNCHGLAMDSDGYLYVSDCKEHEVRRWKIGETSGIVVAGGNGQGNRHDQLNSPGYVFVDQDHAVYVSDASNHRVMKWAKGAKEGIVVAGGNGRGNDVTQISTPYGMFADQSGAIYVADSKNHRVMRWAKGAKQGTVVVGGNGEGRNANQLNHPIGLSVDRQNNIYVVDYLNHRVQKFNINCSANS